MAYSIGLFDTCRVKVKVKVRVRFGVRVSIRVRLRASLICSTVKASLLNPTRRKQTAMAKQCVKGGLFKLVLHKMKRYT